MSVNLKEDVLRAAADSKKPNPSFKPPATMSRKLCIKEKTNNGFYVKCNCGPVIVFDSYFYSSVNFCPYCGCILKVEGK